MDWVEAAFIKGGISIPERKTLIMKVQWIRRPRLSALISAKRRHSTARESRLPAYLTLPGVVTNEYHEAEEPWRKEAVWKVVMACHQRTIKRMQATGLPLRFPQRLGGWGLPGKPEAPNHFFKAAAVILNGQISLSESLKRVFLTARAPRQLRKLLGKQVAIISYLPERLGDKAQPRPVEDVEKEVLQRSLAFHSMDPAYSKINEPLYESAEKIAKRVKKIIKQALSLWKSVKPLRKEKIGLLNTDLERRLVDSRYVDNILFYTGTPDANILYTETEGVTTTPPQKTYGSIPPETDAWGRPLTFPKSTTKKRGLASQERVLTSEEERIRKHLRKGRWLTSEPPSTKLGRKEGSGSSIQGVQSPPTESVVGKEVLAKDPPPVSVTLRHHATRLPQSGQNKSVQTGGATPPHPVYSVIPTVGMSMAQHFGANIYSPSEENAKSSLECINPKPDPIRSQPKLRISLLRKPGGRKNGRT
jgi:hypothetical protein